MNYFKYFFINAEIEFVELNLTGVRWFFRPPKTSIFEAIIYF
jgi:hypothetical protein